MSAADFLDDELDRIAAPCRDARILAWLVRILGADMLLAIIDAQQGGTLGERGQRMQARQRIEELA